MCVLKYLVFKKKKKSKVVVYSQKYIYIYIYKLVKTLAFSIIEKNQKDISWRKYLTTRNEQNNQMIVALESF